MEALINVLLGLHIIGIASLLGGFLMQMTAIRSADGPGPRIVTGMLHGAWTMLATGLLLVGLNEADDQEVNHVKIGVKLTVLLVILALTYVNRDEERVSTPVFGAVGLLTTANIFIATVW